jgi:alpha-1,2-mannosyltransferase
MLDLDVYRTGGAAILHGTGLYSFRAADHLPFTYPPVAAVLAIPLALVPFSVAKAGWLVIIFVPLAVVVLASFRPLLGRAGEHASLAFAVILAGCAYLVPIRQATGFGQVDLILMAICMLDCSADRPRWPRGVFVGLATAIKLEPGVFIVYLLITGRRKDALVAGLSFAAATALGFVISPGASVTYWTRAIFDTGRLGGNAAAGNQSIRGMVLRLFLSSGSMEIWLMAAAVVALAGFASARICWQRGQDLAGVAVTGLVGALLSPVAWIHHLCWIVVAIGLIAGDGRNRRRAALAAAVTALFLVPLPGWAGLDLDPDGLAALPGLIAENSFGLTCIVLVLVLARLASVSGERPAGQEMRFPEGLAIT